MSAGSESPQRPPFDPRRVRGAGEEGGGLFAPTDRPDIPPVMTITQLTKLIAGAIRRAMPGDLCVVGELSNLSEPTGGHLYFTLKDASCEVRCVMWRSSAKSLRFQPADGLEVIATGTVEVYEPRGQYQLYVRKLEPRGVGALELAFRQLKERLEKEGLFDQRRKKPLPHFPERIAIVTSTTGAALRDTLQTIRRRYPCVRVYVFGVRVQGEGAAEEIADAIRRINQASPALGGIDVLIVGRGGGSLEDLWAFNEEIVARAIHASRIPVVSAVGHEVDFTIADFVADVRAATPTAAAELVVPVRLDLLAEVDGWQHRLAQAEQRLLELARSRLSMVERCEWFRDPIGRVRQRQQQMDEAAGRLQLVTARATSKRRSLLHGLQVRLLGVRPEAILARRRELLTKVEHRLQWVIGRLHLNAERRLREAHSRLSVVSPGQGIGRNRLLLDQLAARLGLGISRVLSEKQRFLEAFAARLAASSHRQILNRGFTITRLEKSGKIVQQAGDVRSGDRLSTETSDGRIASRVVDAKQGELFE